MSFADSKHRCSHKLQGNSGVLTSPNYPHLYPDNVDCDWLIHVDVGEVIKLRFNVFSLEEQAFTDYVRVYDGRTQADVLLGEYYGFDGQGVLLESTGNLMYVTMHSDEAVPEKGFSATFQRKGESGFGNALIVNIPSSFTLIVILNLLWGQFAETNQRHFDLLLQILI